VAERYYICFKCGHRFKCCIECDSAETAVATGTPLLCKTCAGVENHPSPYTIISPFKPKPYIGCTPKLKPVMEKNVLVDNLDPIASATINVVEDHSECEHTKKQSLWNNMLYGAAKQYKRAIAKEMSKPLLWDTLHQKELKGLKGLKGVKSV
jgi:hypothetical protein